MTSTEPEVDLAIEDTDTNEAPTSKRRGESGAKMIAFDQLIRTIADGERNGAKLSPKGEQTVRGLALSLSHAVARLKVGKDHAKGKPAGTVYVDVTTGTDAKDGKLKAWATRRIKASIKASK